MFVQKYQPKKFADYVGQECVELLRDFAKGGGKGHNFLLWGAYGSGKTCLARTFAMSRRCSNFKQIGDLCGECSNCKDFWNDPVPDEHLLWSKEKASFLTEPADVDRVLNNYMADQTFFFDETHVLSEEVQYALIEKLDHMMGTNAYGASIFATTEPNRVLAPLRSRSHHIVFRLVPDNILFDHLQRIKVAESIKIDDGALMRIAESGQGHVRDAVMTLETIAGAANEAKVAHIGEEYVLKRLGYADDPLMLLMLVDILENRDFTDNFRKLASRRAMDFSTIVWRVVGQILRSRYDASVQPSYKDALRYGRKVFTVVDHVSSKDFETFADLQQLYLRLELMRYAVADTSP